MARPSTRAPSATAHGAAAMRPRAAATGEELFGRPGDFEARLLASAMGLPRVCSVRKCRRRKRCFGLGIVCLEDHAGLAKKRFPAAMALLGLLLDEDAG